MRLALQLNNANVNIVLKITKDIIEGLTHIRFHLC